MAIDTLPEPSIPITTPFRPGLGFLTATPIIAAATICLSLVILSVFVISGSSTVLASVVAPVLSVVVPVFDEEGAAPASFAPLACNARSVAMATWPPSE